MVLHKEKRGVGFIYNDTAPRGCTEHILQRVSIMCSKTRVVFSHSFMHRCDLRLPMLYVGYWLIMMRWDYISELRPPAGLVFIPRVTWAWSAMVRMMPAGDNSWLVHQSSLVVLLSERSGASRMNGLRSENFSYQYLKYLKGSLTYRKILRHGTSGFTSHPKEGVLRIFIALKNPSPRPRLNPRPFGPMAITLTTTPPRWLSVGYTKHIYWDFSG
jgi:hypothetical protein